MGRRTLPLLLVLTLLGCDAIPTTVLLRIEAKAGLPSPDALALSVFDEQGVEVEGKRLPACAQGNGACPAPTLPNEVVLYPDRDAGTLRILVRAQVSGKVVGEGATKVTLVSSAQVRATVVLSAGRLPDQDGDGVPDSIDSCPALPNPQQGPCTATDGGADIRFPDAGPDQRVPDGPGVDGPGVDGPGVDGPGVDGPGVDGPLAPDHGPDAPAPDTGPPPCTCPLGCVPGTSTCRKLVPANGFSATWYKYAPILSTTAQVDTATCQLKVGTATITGALVTTSATATGKACVLALSKLAIGKGAKLSAAGAHPLVILVGGDVTVAGLLDAGGHDNAPGPGGGAGGVTPTGGPGQQGGGPGGGSVCGCFNTTTSDDCGGGGGGHATAGAKGGEEATPCSTLGAGGKAYGWASLTPLVAGSGGASGNQGTAGDIAGKGGGGGGALQISCQGKLTLTGAISAGGGGGGPGGTSGSAEAGGGGGSGGGVLLEAASFQGSGTVATNGGGGGGGDGGSSGCAGTPTGGEDGGPTLTPAKGGAAAGSACGAGGAGGAKGLAPVKGVDAAAGLAGAGGGGGATGRIRYNWYKHTSSAPFASGGSASTGEATVK